MATKEIVLGGGCFWCIEAAFKRLKGVKEVVSGYANGEIPNPTYKEVCSGTTGYAEVIRVTYDDEIIDTDTLLDIFFTIHDPTTLNRQGADVGTQYRSCICSNDDEILQAAKEAIARAQKKHNDPIVTALEPLKNFYVAEAYHQNYYDNNPSQGYCRIVIAPKLQKLKEKFKPLLK